MNKVLENWESKGYKNKLDIEKEPKENRAISEEQLRAYERLDTLNKQWGSEK